MFRARNYIESFANYIVLCGLAVLYFVPILAEKVKVGKASDTVTTWN